MSNPYSKKIEKIKKKKESEYLREIKKRFSQKKINASEFNPEVTDIDKFIEEIFQRLRKLGYNPFEALCIIYGEDFYKRGERLSDELYKKLFPGLDE